MGLYLVAALVFLAALIFIISATRAKASITCWTDPAAGRMMMWRVRTSGVLMIYITIASATATHIVIHPVGYVLFFTMPPPLWQWNSWLQINSFAPVGDAVPTGPLHTSLRAITLIWDDYWNDTASNKEVEAERSLRGIELLNSFGLPDGMVTRTERTRTQQPAAKISSVRLKNIVGASLRIARAGPQAALGDAPPNTDEHRVNTQDCLDPWKRLGVSLAALDAFKEAYEIGPAMTTDAVCESVIKPRTSTRQCCFIDLMHNQDALPVGWLGPPTFFLSHWWYVPCPVFVPSQSMVVNDVALRAPPPRGYRFVDLVRRKRLCQKNVSNMPTCGIHSFPSLRCSSI